MLHYETIEPGTLALLKKLQSLEYLHDFYLVGGTALALQYGHRKSVDLDLFKDGSFERSDLIEKLRSDFKADFEYSGKSIDWSIFSFINNIKVDFIAYPHSLIDAPLIMDSITMYGPKDIAAMKLNAILGKGERKDFYDVCELLNHYTLKNLIDFYNTKFPTQSLLISIPEALTYFDDAENGKDPISLIKINWSEVKQRIRTHVNNFLK